MVRRTFLLSITRYKSLNKHTRIRSLSQSCYSVCWCLLVLIFQVNFMYSIYAFAVHSRSIWAHCSAAVRTHIPTPSLSSLYYLIQGNTTHICTYFTVLCHCTARIKILVRCCATVVSQVCYYVISGYLKFFYKLPSNSTSFNKNEFFVLWFDSGISFVCVSVSKIWVYNYTYRIRMPCFYEGEKLLRVLVLTQNHFYYTHIHFVYEKAHMLPMARYPLIRIENEITHKVGHKNTHTHALSYSHAMQYAIYNMLFPWSF